MTAPPGARRLGVAVALLGMLLFALNDVMGKWLVATYSVGQVVLLRSVAALLVLAPVLWTRGVRLWPLERPKVQFFRVAASTLEVWCFYYAVASLPLADVMTYWLAGPIYVAAAAPLVLGERVGPWRWAAILVGFAGVVVALRPGAQSLDLPVLVSLFGSAMFAFMVLGARMLRATPDGALVFWQIVGALVAGLVTAWDGWAPPTPRDAGLLALLGVVAMVAHLLIARSLKLADAATIAPLQYTLLLWAILFGWLVFAEVPERAVLAGAALITASGLVIWLRESRARRPPRPRRA
ncbi:DMT family transporter [Amaricoccus sp.]|uniref:DMT family transporter n=1 Tax=Amaricoccus sp. TaxID=1872485 RepID=UPI001B538252|nr:DMT family transporter [Amaricoccus sp.]MBP7001445.1 DMT family transporter [Amaricoccus sp.]